MSVMAILYFIIKIYNGLQVILCMQSATMLIIFIWCQFCGNSGGLRWNTGSHMERAEKLSIFSLPSLLPCLYHKERGTRVHCFLFYI